VSWEDSGARTGPHEIGLIARFAAVSDEDAARRLYRKYQMELFRFGFHVLRDQGLAEEMAQETFIKFCQQAGRYDARRGPVRAWLFTIAKSAAYDVAASAVPAGALCRPGPRPGLRTWDFTG
jgi:Sigma-70 region 2